MSYIIQREYYEPLAQYFAKMKADRDAKNKKQKTASNQQHKSKQGKKKTTTAESMKGCVPFPDEYSKRWMSYICAADMTASHAGFAAIVSSM